MTMNVESLTRRFATVFAPEQATVLAVAIDDAYNQLVKADDFNELKEIVRGLAKAQVRTEKRMGELVQAQQEMAQAQQELAQSQQDTDSRLGQLADVVSNLAQEMGGLSRSVSYSLENEAYRLLPAFLETEYGIVVEERMVRTVIGDEEIDLFALGQRDGVPIVLVGETKLQLDRRRGGRDAAAQALEQLARKAEVVQPHYPEREVVRLLVTHFARPAVHADGRRHVRLHREPRGRPARAQPVAHGRSLELEP